MTHASWNNEHGEPAGPGHDNERLEYLGDAVLELVVGEYLFRRFPTYDEGQLTQLRAALVNTTSLARLGERLELGETLLMGRGAVKTGARKLPSLLANAFEAMIGAIFLDQGYRAATKVFLQNIGDLAEWSDENFKGQLQQASQDRTGDTPHYRVVATGGPGHKREYTAEVLLGERVGGHRARTDQAGRRAGGRARRARQAEQDRPRRRRGRRWRGARRRQDGGVGACPCPPPRRRGRRRSWRHAAPPPRTLWIPSRRRAEPPTAETSAPKRSRSLLSDAAPRRRGSGRAPAGAAATHARGRRTGPAPASRAPRRSRPRRRGAHRRSSSEHQILGPGDHSGPRC